MTLVEIQEQIERCRKAGYIGYGNREASFCHSDVGERPQWCIGDCMYVTKVQDHPEKYCPKIQELRQKERE